MPCFVTSMKELPDREPDGEGKGFHFGVNLARPPSTSNPGGLMRAAIAFALVSLSSSLSLAAVTELSCYSTEPSFFVRNDENGALIREDEIIVRGEYSTKTTILAKKMKVQKTSRANMYDVLDENGKAVMTLKHDGEPSNLNVEASMGTGTILSCRVNEQLVSFAPARNRTQFCGRQSLSNVQNILRDSSNRLAFPNGPYGMGRAGVCWWHNMLERNAAYLARLSRHSFIETHLSAAGEGDDRFSRVMQALSRLAADDQVVLRTLQLLVSRQQLVVQVARHRRSREPRSFQQFLARQHRKRHRF